MTNLTIRGDINENMVKSAILDIYLKWKIPDSIEEILVIDDSKHFRTISRRIPRDLRAEFRETYFEDPTSVSITAGDFDLIVISITNKNEQYLKKNSLALQGIIAHELMHIEQRRRGLDLEIRKSGIEAFNKFKPKLKKLYKKYPKKDIDLIFSEIGRQANFTLKDVYANDELIKVGLGEAMLEDYTNYYINQKTLKQANLNFNKYYNSKYCSGTSKKKCKEIYKTSFQESVGSAVIFELGLLPIIIPFGKVWLNNGNRKIKRLLNFIGDHYEIYIPDIANNFDPLIKHSFNNLKNTRSYQERFFKTAFNVAYSHLNNSPINNE